MYRKMKEEEGKKLILLIVDNYKSALVKSESNTEKFNVNIFVDDMILYFKEMNYIERSKRENAIYQFARIQKHKKMEAD